MAEQSKIIDDVRPASSRVAPWVFFWLIFCAFVLAVVILADQRKLYLLSAPLFLFGLVSLANEVRGVVLSDTTISFPLRVFRAFPLLTWGRKTIAYDDLYHVELLKDCDIQQTIVITNQLKGFGIYFPGTVARNTFLLAARDCNRGLGFIENISPAGLMTYRPIMIGLDLVFALGVALLLGVPHVEKITPNKREIASISKKSDGSSRTGSINADVGSFMLHAASYDWATTSRKKVQKVVDQVQKCSGVTLKITTNSEFKFLTPAKKWLISAGPFTENEANVAKQKLLSCGALDLKVKEAEAEEP